jgi:YbbR domain-containing protein
MDIENPEIVKSFDNVPISLVNIERVESNGLLLANPTELKVNLKLKGRRSELLNLPISSIRVTADLYGAVKGYNSIPLNFVIDNENVYMTNASQRDLNLYLDKIVEIPKKVDIKISGTLPEGYSSGQVEVTPQEIIVRGPEKLVNEVAKLIGSLDISDLKKDVLKEIPIVAVDNDGNVVNGVEVKTPYVNAGIGVFKTSEFPVEIVFLGAVPEGYRITKVTTNPEKIRVIGKEEDMLYFTKVVPESTDVNEITESFEVKLPLNLPKELASIDSVEFITATVTVEKIITATFTYDFKDISFLNMTGDLTVQELTTKVSVRVKGIESVISSMKKEDVSLLVDLTDYVAGTHVVPLQIKSNELTDEIITDIQSLEIQLGAN